MCIADRSDDEQIGRLQASDWRRILEAEVPSALLLLGLPLLVLGFYHQRWISAYLPKRLASGLDRDLLAAFRDEVVLVSDEL